MSSLWSRGPWVPSIISFLLMLFFFHCRWQKASENSAIWKPWDWYGWIYWDVLDLAGGVPATWSNLPGCICIYNIIQTLVQIIANYDYFLDYLMRISYDTRLLSDGMRLCVCVCVRTPNDTTFENKLSVNRNELNMIKITILWECMCVCVFVLVPIWLYLILLMLLFAHSQSPISRKDREMKINDCNHLVRVLANRICSLLQCTPTADSVRTQHISNNCGESKMKISHGFYHIYICTIYI